MKYRVGWTTSDSLTSPVWQHKKTIEKKMGADHMGLLYLYDFVQFSIN